MKKRLVLMALVTLGGAASQVIAKADSATTLAAFGKGSQNLAKVTPLEWGKADASGLHLGAQHVEGETALLAVTRNIGKKSVFYNVYPAATSDGIALEARLVGTKTWTPIALQKSAYRMAEGIGPSAYKVVELKPNQQMPDYTHLPRYKNEEFMTFKIGNAIYKTLPIRKSEGRSPEVWIGSGWPSPLPTDFNALPPYSFRVNLLAYEWPADWKSDIEVRFVQSFSSDKERPSWEGKLKSGFVRVAQKIFRGNVFPSLEKMTGLRFGINGSENASDR